MKAKLRHKANHDIAERVTALGQVRVALEYYCSGVSAEQQLKLAHSEYAIFPVYFLLGHSIELSFKSLLRKYGMTPDEYRTRAIGHDLTSCLRHAESACPTISDILAEDDRNVLLQLNYQYSNKGFEYFGSGTIHHLPTFEAARYLAHKILGIVISEIPLSGGLLRGTMGQIYNRHPRTRKRSEARSGIEREARAKPE